MSYPVLQKYGDLLNPAIQTKLDEFRILGYPTIKANDIWECLHAKRWKRSTNLALHIIVNDIISLKVGEIINYQTVEAFKSPSLLLNKEELEAL